MSLVGVFKCIDGIVGIGDFRSTISNNDYKGEELDRKCQKVFLNEHFIVAFYGANTLVIDDKKVKLEDIMPEIMTRTTSVDDFVKLFMERTVGNDSIYSFLYGTKISDEGYIIGKICIKEGTCEKNRVFSSCIFGGDSKYFSAMANLSINPNKNTEEIALKLEKALKSLMDFYSVEDIYQTVGTDVDGSVDVKIFK